MNVLLKDIPKCFHEDLLFATILMPNRQKCVLFLLKNYTLYEIQSSKLLHTINLKESFKEYNAQTQFVRYSLESEENNITMGKYILNHGINSRYFILLKICNKLVILERKSSGYILIKELGNVDRFEISDPDKLYQAHIYIFYIGETDSTKICLEDSISIENIMSDVETHFKVKELVETIKKARTDLAVKTEETKRIFLNTKNLETFGCNFIRSHEIGEKLILNRCGDIWMKVHNDFLVIGIPVSNNCSERLNTLQNIRPILNFDDQNGLEFQYNLYEIIKGETEINLDSLEWVPSKIRCLRPDSFAVITITVSLNNFYNLSSNAIICFIAYDIYHENQKFTQNLFVKKFEIDTEILYNSKYQLDFNPCLAIHCLTVAETSVQHIFNTIVPAGSKKKIINNFEMIFSEQLKFNMYEESEAMDIDNKEGEPSDQMKLKIFYQFKYSSCNFWYGTVIIFSQLSENKFKMKIYSKSESKIIVLIQMLYKNCTEKIKIFPENYISKEDCLQNVEYALCEEINLGAQITKEHDNGEKILRRTIFDLQQKLFVKELQTDVCISQLNEQ